MGSRECSLDGVGDAASAQPDVVPVSAPAQPDVVSVSAPVLAQDQVPGVLSQDQVSGVPAQDQVPGVPAQNQVPLLAVLQDHAPALVNEYGPPEEEVKKVVNVEDEDMDISEPLAGGLLGLAMDSIYEDVGVGVSGVAEGRSNNSIIDEEAPMKRKMTKPMPPGTKKKNYMISEPQFGGPATFGMMNEPFGGARSKRPFGSSANQDFFSTPATTSQQSRLGVGMQHYFHQGQSGGQHAQHPGAQHGQHPGGHAQHPGGQHAQHPGGQHAQHPRGQHAQHPVGQQAQNPEAQHTQHPGGQHAQHPGGQHTQYHGGQQSLQHGGQQFTLSPGGPQYVFGTGGHDGQLYFGAGQLGAGQDGQLSAGYGGGNQLGAAHDGQLDGFGYGSGGQQGRMEQVQQHPQAPGQVPVPPRQDDLWAVLGRGEQVQQQAQAPDPLPPRSTSLPLKTRTANVPKAFASESSRLKGGPKGVEKGVLVKMGHEIVNPLVEKKYVILKSNAFMQTLA